MSNVSLFKLFDSIPEHELAQAFVANVKNLFDKREILKARKFLNKLYDIEGYEYSKVVVGSLLVSGYLDEVDLNSALEIYSLMEALCRNDEIICIRARSLEILAEYLLPERCKELLEMWERLEIQEPPLEALASITRIGMKILKIALENDDLTAKKTVYRYLYLDGGER